MIDFHDVLRSTHLHALQPVRCFDDVAFSMDSRGKVDPLEVEINVVESSIACSSYDADTFAGSLVMGIFGVPQKAGK